MKSSLIAIAAAVSAATLPLTACASTNLLQQQQDVVVLQSAQDCALALKDQAFTTPDATKPLYKVASAEMEDHMQCAVGRLENKVDPTIADYLQTTWAGPAGDKFSLVINQPNGQPQWFTYEEKWNDGRHYVAKVIQGQVQYSPDTSALFQANVGGMTTTLFPKPTVPAPQTQSDAKSQPNVQ